MHLFSAISRIIIPIHLDPLAAILYAAAFAGIAMATARRPVYGLVALILAQPFAFERYVFHTTITLPKVALLAVILGLSTYVGIFGSLRERPARTLLLAGGLVAAAMALSIIVAAYPLDAVRQVMKAIWYVAIFAAGYAAYRADPDEFILRYAIVGTTVLVACSALVQEIIGAPSALLFHGTVIPRIAGALDGPNQLAGYLEISLAFLIALAITTRSRAVPAAIGLVIFTDVLTFSRGGWLGAAVATLTVAWIYRERLRLAELRLPLALIAGTVIVGIGAWGIDLHSLGFLRLFSLQSSYAGGVGTRPELWHAAVVLWLRHPWLGVGAGNYQDLLGQVGLPGIRTHANSLYLQAIVEGGLPLLAATLWLTWTSIVTFLRSGSRAVFVVAAGAASLALATHQIVDYLTFYAGVGGWWWLALALGAGQLSQAPVQATLQAPVQTPACE